MQKPLELTRLTRVWGDLQQAKNWLSRLSAPWCFCGGCAIDLFLDQQTRAHQDVDVAIRRQDQLAFQHHLRQNAWKLEVVHEGMKSPWREGDMLSLPVHTIWCTRGEEFLELLF